MTCEPTDEALLIRAKSGDSDAFARLAVRHRARVRGVLFRLLGPSDLDDHEQEVFIAVWRALGGFRGESSVSNWILAIVVHRATRVFGRRRAGREVVRLARAVSEAHEDRPGASLARRERREAVQSAVERLPFRLRTAVVLRFAEGLSVRDVAAILGKAEGTVRSDLFEARRVLARSLGFDPGDGDG